jgi:hypothetical protein
MSATAIGDDPAEQVRFDIDVDAPPAGCRSRPRIHQRAVRPTLGVPASMVAVRAAIISSLLIR